MGVKSSSGNRDIKEQEILRKGYVQLYWILPNICYVVQKQTGLLLNEQGS